MPEQPRHCIVAILPCNDIEASTAFYSRLGLSVYSDHGRYRILSDGKGWALHLSSEAPEGWVVSGRNPNGLYLYLEDVDGLAARVSDLIVGVGPEKKALGHV
jgi:catechol 2,3-dioxygenase-like lactoylglutathione lyase family enzyme